jgi:RND family efflux transporter MFP subunit
MKSGTPKLVIPAILLMTAAAGWIVFGPARKQTGVEPGPARRPVPVEVAPVSHGPIELKRTFSGELEALAEFVVAPKVSGRVKRVFVNIADMVQRGQVVAELDNDEYVQAVAQARADLAVARANLSAAKSGLEIAVREFSRTESLVKRGISSDSEYDASRQDRLAKEAQLKVAEAQVARAEASLETANIRLGYTEVNAEWSGGDDYRVVAERYVDEGQTVAANAPLVLIDEIDPILGVVFVTERDYARLQPGQTVSLTTDAYPGESFAGRIDRIAPFFRKTTRQARIELTVDNPRRRLKPGMFIRATVVLARVPDAVIVPEPALTLRDDKTGVFVVGEDGRTVFWCEVTVGIREDDRVQVESTALPPSGRVVTLGQELVSDGSPITISNGNDHTPSGRDEGVSG